MATKTETFLEPFLKKDLPDIRAGDTIKVYQKIPARIATRSVAGGKDKDKERTQAFEGLVIARKHGKGITSTITVRKVILGIGVEKIFPIHSPTIEKIEIIKRGRARRAKLYYLREAKGKRARLKKREFAKAIGEEEAPEEVKKDEKMEPEPESKLETESESEK